MFEKSRLVVEDSTAIGEVPANLRYLEEVYPGPPLFGATPMTMALVASANAPSNDGAYIL
jgi:glutathione S-transferase